jgi:predicted transcriptional regulator
VQESADAWDFASAWVLSAVAIWERPCSLSEVVQAGDALNHAILLDQEVEGAMRKLLGSGLVTVTAGRDFALTRQGAALVSRRKGDMFSQVKSVQSMLDSVPVRSQDFTLERGAMEEAIDAYRDRTRGR